MNLRYGGEGIAAVWAAEQKRDGEGVLMVKFERSEFQEMVETGKVELVVEGELTDGSIFEGSDTIKVIDPRSSLS
ncbi:MAG: hypothetical protein ACOC55_04100 [Candidatus Natronoplasma sp.]